MEPVCHTVQVTPCASPSRLLTQPPLKWPHDLQPPQPASRRSITDAVQKWNTSEWKSKPWANDRSDA